MANRILGVLFKKKYANGDTDTIYPKTRAQDVTTTSGTTLEAIATKVNDIQTGATKVEKSSTNGNILINGAQTVVYTHPNSGATAGTYNKVTVNAQGHVTSGSNVTDWTGTVSGDVSNGTVTSEQSSSRSNLASGEKLSVSMGKIRKWLADLKSLAFVDKVGTSNLDSTLTTFYNNRVTTDKVTQSTSITEAGWVADARVIRTLQNQINTLNSNVQSKVPLVNQYSPASDAKANIQVDADGNIMTTFVLENSATVLYKTWFKQHADGFSQFDLPYMTFSHRPAGDETWVNDLVVTSANLTQLMKNRMSVWGYVTQSYSSITNKATKYVELTSWANNGIERVDRMVHVHVLFKIIAKIPDWSSFVFFTLPTNCRPYRAYNTQFGSAGASHEYIQAFIESGGNVQLKGGSSIPVNTEFMLDIVFPSPSVSYDF